MASQLDGLAKLIARELAAELIPFLAHPEQTEERKLLPLKDAAKYMSRSQSSIRAMIGSGEIPEDVVKRIGRRVYLRKAELDRWLVAQ